MINQRTLPCDTCVYKDYCQTYGTDCGELFESYTNAEKKLNEAVTQNASEWTILTLTTKFVVARNRYNDYFFKAFEETGEVPF